MTLYSLDSSKIMGTFPEVLDFNKLVPKSIGPSVTTLNCPINKGYHLDLRFTSKAISNSSVCIN